MKELPYDMYSHVLFGQYHYQHSFNIQFSLVIKIQSIRIIQIIDPYHKSKVNPDNPHKSGHRPVYQVKGQPTQFRSSQGSN
jgi:hypothetical protein